VVALAVLGACHPAPPPPRTDWIIHSQLVFLSADLKSERPPLARGRFRLFFPYIAGDIYGSPTTGDFINPTLDADYRFTIDLNRTHQALLASLEPTALSVPYLHIEPAAARVARLAPMVLEVDGIEPIGRTQWVDGDTRRELVLLYFDRPAVISGGKFAVHAPAGGYVWVGLHGDVYTVMPTPVRLLLAVTASDLVQSALQ
jgi:hypothetical protein